MSTATGEQRIGVQATLPGLWELRFARTESDEPSNSGKPPQLRLNLTLARPHDRHLIVALEVTAKAPAWSELSVSYRMAYFVRGMLDEQPLRDLLYDLGTRTGPAALFPFIREAIATATQRAGLAGVMLPMMDFGQLKWEDPIKLPEPQEAAPPEFLEPLQIDHDNTA
jgi:preprotein translocase subunit SecB